MIAKFLQFNLHTSVTAQDLVMRMAFKKEVDILLIMSKHFLINKTSNTLSSF